MKVRNKMKSFNEIYEEIYRENHENLENLRKKNSRKYIYFLVIILVTVFLVYIEQIIFAFLLFIIFTIFLLKSIDKKRNYVSEFKEKVIEPFIKNIDDNLEYSPTSGIEPYLYKQGEFEGFDIYRSEDKISGKLDGKYNLIMGEVITEEERVDSEGNSSSYTLFHGIFGYVECAKNITTKLKIHSDKGLLGKVFQGKTKIEMDSSEFEKYFDVYGENKIIAMQILTSDVMDLMISFRQESKIQYELTIKDNRMYIRFHTGDVFEPKAFKKALDYNMLKRYYDIIDFIFKVSKAINKAIENTEI